MRHLLVTNDFPPKVGGIQTYLWELWRRLPSPEDVTVLTTPHPDADEFDRRQPFGRIVRTGRAEPVLLPTPLLAHRIDRLATDAEADFIVLDPALPVGLLGPDLARRGRHRYVVVMHGSELIGRLPVGSPLMGHVLGHAAHVIAAGTYPADETRRTTPNRTPPITIVPPGVDADRFRPPHDDHERHQTRRRFGLPTDRPLVLGLSRIVRRKGFDVLIDAAARIGPEVAFAIGGDGRDRPRLERRIAERNATNVTMLGRVPHDDLPAVYGCADAFAMLCRDQWAGLEKEGFGIVFVEAAATGTPQIAGRSGGSADAVVDGETGFVLDDPTDVDAVVDAITKVLDPATNDRFRKASRERVERELTYDVLASKLAAALEQVAGDSR